MKFLHAADLHLSLSEADYGFSVLEELLALSALEGEGVLVLSGDAFDSNEDLMALWKRFRAAAEASRGLRRVLLIAGNHDRLRGSRDPRAFDLGAKIGLAWDEPLVERLEGSQGGAEFVLIPYACAAPALGPPAADRPRVVCAHGSLPELNWIGPPGEEGEERRSTLDGAGLLSLKPVYLALGHVHEGGSAELKGCLAAYPGSARVWRRGEEGPRYARLAEVRPDAPAGGEKRELRSAGRYRQIACALLPGGELRETPALAALESFSAADRVDLRVSGLARTEGELVMMEESLRGEWGGKFRRLDIDHDEAIFLSDPAQGQAAAEFMRAWEAKRAKLEEIHGQDAVMKALGIGLARIARSTGGKA